MRVNIRFPTRPLNRTSTNFVTTTLMTFYVHHINFTTVNTPNDMTIGPLQQATKNATLTVYSFSVVWK